MQGDANVACVVLVGVAPGALNLKVLVTSIGDKLGEGYVFWACPEALA